MEEQGAVRYSLGEEEEDDDDGEDDLKAGREKGKEKERASDKSG